MTALLDAVRPSSSSAHRLPPSVAQSVTHPVVQPATQPTTHPAATAASPAPSRCWDPCAAAHKALRHALSRQLQSLGRLDVSDAAAVRAATQRLQRVLDALDGHRRADCEVWLPALASRRPGQPGLVDAALQDHLDDLARSAGVQRLAHELAQAQARGQAEAAAALQRLQRAFEQHLAQQLQMMAREEQLLMPLLDALFDADERRRLARRAQALLPPWERLELALLMADALNPDELALMLHELQDGLAPEAWVQLAIAVRGRVGPAWPQVAAASAALQGQSCAALPAGQQTLS